MKREILFRGKRVDNGEWVEGSLYETIYNTYIIQKHDETRTALNAISVIPETVGQFTGLTDQNGKRIFEGDVLGGCNGSINGHRWEQKPILIKFSEGRFNVPLWAAKGEWDSTHYLVVIGNTHDNPELS